MEVKIFKPQNALLKRYIECFYVLRRNSAELNRNYLTFPSNFTIVSSILNAKIEVVSNRVMVAYHPQNSLETYLTLNHNEPALVNYKGEIEEVTIYFKPLGINAFLREELCFYYKNQYPNFDPFIDYQKKMSEILSNKNDEKKISLLENYWLSKFNGFSHPFLPQIIEFLENHDSSNLSQIADNYGITRATLNNHFARHLCKTPSEFRKIIRFRKAMQKHLSKTMDENLTDITYKANYFDQSHFVKEFKTFTGFSPKKFFAQVSSFENGQINWLFF